MAQYNFRIHLLLLGKGIAAKRFHVDDANNIWKKLPSFFIKKHIRVSMYAKSHSKLLPLLGIMGEINSYVLPWPMHPISCTSLNHLSINSAAFKDFSLNFSAPGAFSHILAY